MRADAKSRGNPIQEIFWTRTGLLLLILIVVSGGSMIISAMMSAGTLRNIVTALATGTLVTAIVGFGQTLITASATQRAMVTPLIEENRRALRELSEEYRSLNREFFPTNVFEATNDPDPALNHLMMQDLRNTRQYFFRGFSGRYAAARLLLSRSEWELRAVVADPRERTAITGRARYLIRHEGVLADFETIQDRLHEDIHVGLLGLYLARSRCSRIDVAVIADPPLDRLEMFDESVWITLYSDSGPTTLYPRTLRFSEGSFIYNMERAEFGRLRNTRGARHVVITPDTTRGEFLAQFEKVTGARPTEQRFAELEAKFHAFRHEFSLAAELGELIAVRIRSSALTELAGDLRGTAEPLTERWDLVDRCFHAWIARPDLRATLRTHLLELPSDEARQVIERSRETTTHFAWCLRDRFDEPFTFWLHEYKPQQDWRDGYADSVHNHRYHFCTTIVRGGYLHERYEADIDPTTELVTAAALVESTPCEVGSVGTMRSADFHRIPLARDATMTFLVKSREVAKWSLSYDPATQTGHRHIPVESRLDELAKRM